MTHPHLASQLVHLGLDPAAPPTAEGWAAFLQRVDASYSSAEQGRCLPERTIEVSSRETPDPHEAVRSSSASALAEERDRLMTVISSVGDGICVIDETGCIETANEEASRLLGVSDPVGRCLAQVARVADVETADGAHRPLGLRYTSFGLRERSDGCTLVREDGSRVAVAYDVSPLRAAGRRPGAAIVIRDISTRMEADAEARSRQRIIEAVARGFDPRVVYARIAEEAGLGTGADRVAVLRLDLVGAATVLGSWQGDGAEWLASGTPIPIQDCPALRRVVEAERTGRPPARPELSCGGYLAHPLRIGTTLWGVLLVRTASRSTAAPPRRLAPLAEIATLAVTSLEARQELLTLAASDPLTGLANHRAFQEELRARAADHAGDSETLALALIDIDRFKEVNDAFGHPQGDAVLRELAVRLRRVARRSDVVARLGGDEFAWVFPARDELSAWSVVDRARAAVTASPFARIGHVTISGGVATLDQAASVEELIRLADGALYAAKRRGRNGAVLFDADAVEVFSAFEHVDQMERRQALHSIRVLARAVDAKDHLTQAHSDRVAHLAADLATALGWQEDRIGLLEEAGLVHDVGKIGVPDAILFKEGALAPEERAQMEAHSLLGARIVEGVLTGGQVSWVRGHHERWDGLGYPDGLRGRDIPLGARVLAVADAWDTMTSGRPNQRTRSPEEALAECRTGSGSEFCPEVVAALEGLFEDGFALPARPGIPLRGAVVGREPRSVPRESRTPATRPRAEAGHHARSR